MLESNSLQGLIRTQKDDLILPWTVATVVLGVMAIVAASLSQDALPRDLHGAISAAFWALSLTLAVMSVVLPMQKLTERHVIGSMRVEPNPHKLAARLGRTAVDAERLREISALPKNEQRMLGLLQLSTKPMLIGLLLSDAIATTSVVYSIVAQNLFAGLPMLGLAFGLNVWHFPRVERLLARARKAAQDASVEEFDKEMRQMERDLKKRPRKPPRS